MAERINNNSVPPQDQLSISVFGKNIPVASDCMGCDYLDPNGVKQDLYIQGGFRQLSFSDEKISSAPGTPRREKELVQDEVLKRALGGISGNCVAICTVDDCWRKQDIPDESEEYKLGHELAIQADAARTEILRIERQAKNHKNAASTIILNTPCEGDIERGKRAVKRSKKQLEYTGQEEIKAERAKESFDALLQAAGNLLGLPDNNDK